MSSFSAFEGSAFISNYATTKAFNVLLAARLEKNFKGYIRKLKI